MTLDIYVKKTHTNLEDTFSLVYILTKEGIVVAPMLVSSFTEGMLSKYSLKQK